LNHKELGNTGEMIPDIGLGTWLYTGGSEPLRKGISLGASHIDTAEMYGTEEAVGRAIKGIRNQVFLTTKVWPPNFNHANVIKAAEGSLRLLGTEYVDLYLLHWPNSDIPIGETMGAMDQLLTQGKIRFIGVSNFSVDQLMEAQSVTSNPIVNNQVKYSLSTREVEQDLFPYCMSNNVTVTAYSPISPVFGKSTKRLAGTLKSIAKDLGKTEAQIALNWCVSHKNVIFK